MAPAIVRPNGLTVEPELSSLPVATSQAWTAPSPLVNSITTRHRITLSPDCLPPVGLTTPRFWTVSMLQKITVRSFGPDCRTVYSAAAAKRSRRLSGLGRGPFPGGPPELPLPILSKHWSKANSETKRQPGCPHPGIGRFALIRIVRSAFILPAKTPFKMSEGHTRIPFGSVKDVTGRFSPWPTKQGSIRV